jgi:hypothetical protein
MREPLDDVYSKIPYISTAGGSTDTYVWALPSEIPQFDEKIPPNRWREMEI